MTFRPSIFRKAYDTVAMFALLNLFGGALLAGLLIANGSLDAEKARRIVAVMRGAALADATPGAAGAADGSNDASPADRPPASPMAMEIRRLEAERIKTELDQRLALNNSILLKVSAEREKFQKERQEAGRQMKLAAEKRESEGYQKQIAILEALSPKLAVSHLLSIPEPDEAARILVEMDTRNAKAIVEQAKTGEQIEKMKLVLQRVREVSPVRSDQLAEQQP